MRQRYGFAVYPLGCLAAILFLPGASQALDDLRLPCSNWFSLGRRVESKLDHSFSAPSFGRSLIVIHLTGDDHSDDRKS
jgi:hypothetical protein